MRTYKYLFMALLCVCLFGGTSGTHDHDGVHTALNAVALNAAAASRTFTIGPVDGFATIQFWFDFDYTAVAGVISLTCTGGPTSADKDYTLTVCDSASTEGECSAKTSGILKSEGQLSADTKWDARLGMRGARYLSCLAAHDNTPGATDLLTVKWESYTQ